MDLYEMKDYIFKRLEELGLYSYDVGNRRKWYYSNPDFQEQWIYRRRDRDSDGLCRLDGKYYGNVGYS